MLAALPSWNMWRGLLGWPYPCHCHVLHAQELENDGGCGSLLHGLHSASVYVGVVVSFCLPLPKRKLCTGTCSSISSFSWPSLSIITTSPCGCSPSIFASSSFLHHGTATIISRLLRSHLAHAVFLWTVIENSTSFRFNMILWLPGYPKTRRLTTCTSTFQADLLLVSSSTTFLLTMTPCTIFLPVAHMPFCRGDRLRTL